MHSVFKVRFENIRNVVESEEDDVERNVSAPKSGEASEKATRTLLAPEISCHCDDRSTEIDTRCGQRDAAAAVHFAAAAADR